jgi:hypothetical protein
MHRLIAVLLSDGYVNPRRYTASFTENKELVMQLVRDFSNIHGIPLQWKTEKHHNSVRARTYSKQLLTELYQFCNTFRTRPCSQHPACNDKKTCKVCRPEGGYPQIQLSSEIFPTKTEKRNFLRYFASCDGGVSISVYRRKDNNYLQLSKEIKLGSTNPQIRALIKALLANFDFRKPLERTDGIVFRNHDDFIQFQSEIGFLEQAKVKRGRFKGFSKNELLSLAIKCGNHTEKRYWINPLKTKERVMQYILSLRE